MSGLNYCGRKTIAIIAVLTMAFCSLMSARFVYPEQVYADTAAQAETWIYVNGQSGSDSNDGSSAGAAGAVFLARERRQR